MASRKAANSSLGRQCLGEDRVRAGLDIGGRAGDGGIQAFDVFCIGARHDEKILVPTRVDRGIYFLHHRVPADQQLIVEMTAALGQYLILDMASGKTRLLQLADRACDVHRLAEAGIGVDQRRQVGDPGDLPAALDDFGGTGQADIR